MFSLRGKGLCACPAVCCVSLFAAFFQFGAFFLVRRIKRAAEAQAEAHADAEPCRGRLKRSAEAQAERMEAVVATFTDRAVSIDRLDGVTVDLGEGTWFNLRASNTEPLLRLNAEAPTSEGVGAIVDEVLAIVRA